MEEIKTCKHCKKEINKSVKICPYCLKIQSNSVIKLIGLFLLVIVVIGSISSTFNSSTSSSSKNGSSSLKKSNYSTNTIQEDELKANSNEKLSYLVKKGQNKAKNASTEEIKEAINCVKNNINNPFANNDIMESLIYYGTVLEYYYAKDSSSFNGFTDVKGEIGMYTVIAVKYVYRNIENSTDEATIRNINKVKERLAKTN